MSIATEISEMFEASKIDSASILKNLKSFKSGALSINQLVDKVSVDLGIKASDDKKALANLKDHLHIIQDDIEDASDKDLKDVSSELLDMF